MGFIRNGLVVLLQQQISCAMSEGSVDAFAIMRNSIVQNIHLIGMGERALMLVELVH